MKSDPRPLGEILEEAKSASEPLEKMFDVPVLFVVVDDPAQAALIGNLTITSASTPKPLPDFLNLSPTGLVVAIQPRNAKAASTRYTFGRASICDVMLPFAPISKYHGYFEQRDGSLFATDVGSTNGTIVNGRPMRRDEPKMLENGAVLQFGAVIARLFTAPAFLQLVRQRLADADQKPPRPP